MFMQELWDLLVSAQQNIGGIPTQMLEQKKEEIRLKKVRGWGRGGICTVQHYKLVNLFVTVLHREPALVGSCQLCVVCVCVCVWCVLCVCVVCVLCECVSMYVCGVCVCVQCVLCVFV